MSGLYVFLKVIISLERAHSAESLLPLTFRVRIIGKLLQIDNIGWSECALGRLGRKR